MRSRIAASVYVTLLLATACTGAAPRSSSHPASPTLIETARSCHAAVDVSPLPTWARGGFTPPGQAIAHVSGLRGDIVGVLFGYPLHAPPLATRRNKILWVARAPGSGTALQIRASLNGSSLVVDRAVAGGPGLSIVDVPKAGCWTFHLSWSGHEDEVAIPYAAA
jgi:hypothetical protein